MAERLTFVADMMSYSSMLSAEHLSRYSLVKNMCVGRRVLDIACGEGYGSSLMSSWGAKEVFGVDISAEAIANAVRVFSKESIHFIQHDARDCAELEDVLGSIDLIVCFETIEHIEDVKRMLTGFKALSANNPAIVISCPNDNAINSTESNEFHVRTYSFEEFEDTVTSILGEPDHCVFGTSVLGFGAFSSDSKFLSCPPSDISGLMSFEDSECSFVLPVQHGHEVNSSNAAYYVAGWNCSLLMLSVVAPISFQAYESPWNNWVAAKVDIESLTTQLIKSKTEVEFFKSSITNSTVEAEGMAVHLVGFEKEIERLKKLLVSSRLEVENLTAQTVAFDAERVINEITLRREKHLRIALEIKNASLIKSSQNISSDDLIRHHNLINLNLSYKILNDELGSQIAILKNSRWHRFGNMYYKLYELPVLGFLLRNTRKFIAFHVRR